MNYQVGVSCKWANDTQRFLLEHFDAIQNSPSQIYYSALPFCPSSSWLHRYYKAEFSGVKVVKGLPTEWGTCARTVVGDSPSCTISCYGTIAVVGLESGKITILDVITGSCVVVLPGHEGRVFSVSLSVDGTLFASGGADETVKLWDMQTGGVIKTFSGHKKGVWSVSISPDSTTIASGSSDGMIYLWNIQTGKCHCVIEQQNQVNFVCFPSMSSQQLIYGLFSGNSFLFSLDDQNIKQEYDVEHVALSPDGTQIALCKGKVVKVQNFKSGIIVAEFHVANGSSSHCCISPDGRLVAAAVEKIVYVWDIAGADSHPIGTFIGHTANIIALAFSSPSCLISACWDRLVKFWQIGTPSTEPVQNDPTSAPSASAEFKSMILHAKNDITVTSDGDGVVRVWDLSNGLCKASFQTPAAGADCSNCQLIDGRLIMAWYAERKIHVLDIEKQELLEVDGPEDTFYQLRISGDGIRIFCMGFSHLQSYSTLTGKKLQRVKFEGIPWDMTWIMDGSRVWLYTYHGGSQGWDFGTSGSQPIELSDPPIQPHPNGAMLWDPIQNRVKDVATGRVICEPPKRYGEPSHVQWKNLYLVIYFTPEDLLILDFGQ